MSTATSIATRNAAEAAVMKAVVVPITTVDYNLETSQKFNRSNVNAARVLPSTIGGGNNGHIFPLETVAAYTTRTSRTGYTKTVHPGAIDFTGATTNAQIARVKETHTTDLETYNNQEGVRAGLCKLTITNVPAKILVVPEDTEPGLDKVKPLRSARLP